MPEKRPCVFIGSSTEGLPVAEAIQVNLDYACEIVLWSQGVFGLGGGTLESLVEKLDTFDFAILVLTPDDLVYSRGDLEQAPRDNVLLELGIFVGALGRKRTFAVCDRTAEIKLPSDLAGVTHANYQPPTSGTLQSAVGAACTLIKEATQELGIRQETSDEPIPHQTDRYLRNLSERVVEIAGYAKKQVHHGGTRLDNEKDYFDKFTRVVRGLKPGQRLRAICGDKNWKLPEVEEYMRANEDAARRGVEVCRLYLELPEGGFPKKEAEVLEGHRRLATEIAGFTVGILRQEHARKARKHLALPKGFGLVIAGNDVLMHRGFGPQGRRNRHFDSGPIAAVHRCWFYDVSQMVDEWVPSCPQWLQV